MHGFTWEIRQKYIDFLKCGNRQLKAVVDLIIDNDPSSIIILQGDHGTYFTNNRYTGTGNPPVNHEPWKEAALKEMYGILSASKVPDACKDKLYNSINAVNTFRFIFACLTLSKPKYLPDLSFWIDKSGKTLELIRKNGSCLY